MEMIEMLKPIAFDVIICMTQLFDYYLYTVYTLFACDMVYVIVQKKKDCFFIAQFF